MKQTITLLLLAAAACLTTACSADNNEEPEIIVCPGGMSEVERIDLTRGELDYVHSTNDFSLRLFSTLRKDGENMFLSPLSVACVLAMLDNGADGDTKAQIEQALGFTSMNRGQIDTYFFKIISQAPRRDFSTTLYMANGLIADTHFALENDFVKRMNMYYWATAERLNFQDPQTLEQVNKWGREWTKGRVPKVLEEMSPDAVAYVLNAIYFEAKWASQFKESDTRDEEFTLADGTKKQVPMMHQAQSFGYARTEKFSVLQMPYGNGAFAMTILLPDEGWGISDVLQATGTINNLTDLTVLHKQEVDVALPRFTTSSHYNLVEALQSMGVTAPFSEEEAQFPYLSQQHVHISQLLQGASVTVNEAGTEAAAVTVGEEVTTALQLFQANRPFLYFISEATSGIIFFIGQYSGE